MTDSGLTSSKLSSLVSKLIFLTNSTQPSSTGVSTGDGFDWTGVDSPLSPWRSTKISADDDSSSAVTSSDLSSEQTNNKQPVTHQLVILNIGRIHYVGGVYWKIQPSGWSLILNSIKWAESNGENNRVGGVR